MDRPLEVHKSDVSTPAFRRFVCSKISSFLRLSATYKQQRSMKSRNRGIFMLIVDLPSIAAQVNMRTAVAIPHTCLTYSFMRLSSGPVRCGGTCKGMSRSRTSGPCGPIGSICRFHQHPVDQSKWNSVGGALRSAEQGRRVEAFFETLAPMGAPDSDVRFDHCSRVCLGGRNKRAQKARRWDDTRRFHNPDPQQFGSLGRQYRLRTDRPRR